MNKRLLTVSVTSIFIACQSEPKETPTQRAERQLHQQSQQAKVERLAEERALMEARQKTLSELPVYQKMQQEQKEKEEREVAQRSYRSSSSYDDLESENEDLRDEIKRLKNQADSEN